jgi:AraC-like DNA-binding protein
VDILADILTITQLTGDRFVHTVCEPPWGLAFEASSRVRVHVVTAGGAVLVPSKGKPVALGPQDLVLLAHGADHALCDDPASPRIPHAQFSARLAQLPAATQDRIAPLKLTTGPRKRTPPCELVCGSYTMLFARTHPVLRLLPEVIHIPGRDVMAHAGLQATLHQLMRELAERDVGSEKVVSRLLDVLFIHVLRHWLDATENTGWLGALRDEPIGRALVLLHTSPARDWTVAQLAREVGLSRAAFARRFADKVGDTPLGYLRRFRLDIATRLLEVSDEPLSAVAAQVGYTSEFAFNRAFQRDRGVPPGRYRASVRDA